MLFDPKWEVKTKPSLAGFVAWLGEQPADKIYDPGKPTKCALGQYFQSVGLPPVCLVSEAAEKLNTDYYDLFRIVIGFSPGLQTFGSAVNRVERVLNPTFWQRVSRVLFF